MSDSFFGVNMRVYETMHRAAVFARKNAHLSLDESMIGKLLNSEGQTIKKRKT